MLQTLRMRNGNRAQLETVALLDANILVRAAYQQRSYETMFVEGIETGGYGGPGGIRTPDLMVST